MKEKKFNYFYKITNNLNGMYYYGVHSTDDLNDGYFGSGKYLRSAIKKYKKENFTKEILKFFSSSSELLKYEEEIVNRDVVDDPMSYNLKLGGGYKSDLLVMVDKETNKVVKIDRLEYRKNPDKFEHINKGKLLLKDKNGNPIFLKAGDPRIKKEGLKGFNSGKVVVEINGVLTRISKDDPRIDSGEAKIYSTHKFPAIDKEGNHYHITRNDPRFLSGELIHPLKGRVTVRDKDGNTFSVFKDDPRLKTGEITYAIKGFKKTEESIQRSVRNRKDSSGKNSPNFGKIYINNGIENKFIKKEFLEEYLGSGEWVIGQLKFKKNYWEERFYLDPLRR